ncbi:ABC transporter permease [Phytoactinopolyspora alkaliphila]|uniref:ABC transporter permease n=1 Tax=Phytoactinopolyspora alkaliphila TaxID=1783498 RepID=A0A6N9YIK3_9ACTN|nr:ABC transporter permease [Phytoactinopolyspora alkaliphila]NED94765.1 ABC transporter permease [Phytoactinopolyspora alkaliphila]
MTPPQITRAPDPAGRSERSATPGRPSFPRRAVRAFRRDPMVRWLTGLVVVLGTVLIVLPLVMSTSPTAIDAGQALRAPGSGNLFGTDQLGRDVAARVVHGARLSFLVAVCSAGAALLLGGVLGAVAASSRGWVNEIIMRIMDVGLAFPGILLAIVLAAAIGPSLWTTVIVLGVIFTPPMARVVRAAVFAEQGEDYVTAATLFGTRKIRLVGYHVGLNAALPVMVYTTLIMAEAVVAEAALSFLGAGIRPPAPSWGNIISEGQSVIDAGAWWVSLFPGLAIVVAVLGLNRFSEALGSRLRSR